VSLPVAILCGGQGTRLYPITRNLPKVLVDVAGQPFIAHQLRLLKKSGVEQVVLCVGQYGEAVRDYVADGRRFGLKVEYSFDGPGLIGTGGALKKALPLVGSRFFVLYGDSYLPCEYEVVAKRFVESGKLALMTVYRNQGQWDTSNIEMSDCGEILVYDKRTFNPRMHHIDYGLGCFRSEALNRIPDGIFFDLATLYAELVAAGQLATYEIAGRFYEIGSFGGINELTKYLTGRTVE
jgi:NDP-sugar pyrophosphorylase family protein